MIAECLLAEFRIGGDDCPLADVTRASGAVVDADTPLLRHDGNALLRFSAEPDPGLTGALEADDRVRYLYRSEPDGRHNFRCLSLHPCVVHALVDAGFMVESLTYRDGDAVLTGTVVGHDVLRGVMETAGETVGVQLERLAPLRADDEAPIAKQWDLTPAQTAALGEAYAMGYFSVPKGATADEVAAALDVSKTAFLERLRRGQEALFGQVFGDAPE